VQGEIHGVGFDTNNKISTSDPFFQLYGTQSWWANQDYKNGPGHYVIPLGEIFTGSFTELVFVNDDDAHALAESTFSNLKIYES
jgi:hypothetical protein